MASASAAATAAWRKWVLISPGSGLDNRDCATPGGDRAAPDRTPFCGRRRGGSSRCSSAALPRRPSRAPSACIPRGTASPRAGWRCGSRSACPRGGGRDLRAVQRAQVLRQVGLGGVDLLQQLGALRSPLHSAEQLEADRRGQQREQLGGVPEDFVGLGLLAGGGVASLMAESLGSAAHALRLAREVVVVAVEHRGVAAVSSGKRLLFSSVLQYSTMPRSALETVDAALQAVDGAAVAADGGMWQALQRCSAISFSPSARSASLKSALTCARRQRRGENDGGEVCGSRHARTQAKVSSSITSSSNISPGWLAALAIDQQRERDDAARQGRGEHRRPG